MRRKIVFENWFTSTNLDTHTHNINHKYALGPGRKHARTPPPNIWIVMSQITFWRWTAIPKQSMCPPGHFAQACFDGVRTSYAQVWSKSCQTSKLQRYSCKYSSTSPKILVAAKVGFPALQLARYSYRFQTTCIDSQLPMAAQVSFPALQFSRYSYWFISVPIDSRLVLMLPR